MNFFKKVMYKTKINIAVNYVLSYFAKIFWQPFKIMDALETIEYICEKRCSIARFGDGELQILAYGCALKFQRADRRLQEKLKEVAETQNENLLLCLPNRINMVTQVERKQLTIYWQKALKQHLYAWTKHLSKKRIYGDTNISRLVGLKTEAEKEAYIKKIVLIWKDRNIIIVEGEKTRFGVGNDLLINAKTVCRILGPAESAFDYYSQILECTKDRAQLLEKAIVLLALGPTATVLAHELSEAGIQAIDIGHLDISYEKMMFGYKAVPGKYTNEEQNGDMVSECNDEKYLKEIITRIGN